MIYTFILIGGGSNSIGERVFPKGADIEKKSWSDGSDRFTRKNELVRE